MTNNETLSNRLVISVNKARSIVDKMIDRSSSSSSSNLKPSSTTITSTSQNVEGRPPRLGLGAKYIPHNQQVKYNPRIKQMLSDKKLKSADKKVETSSNTADDSDDDCSKYKRFKND